MKKLFGKSFVLGVVFTVLLSGCAASRNVIHIQIAKDSNPKIQNDKTVFINSVSDKRIFERNPRRPDIPSLGFGGADRAALMIKKRAVARKRNGFGKALGDVLLDEKQTVESIIRASIVRSYQELGYRVVDNKEDVEANTEFIDVTIDKFWSWMNLGLWVTLSAEIEVKIENASNQREPILIYAKASDKYAFAVSEYWIDILSKCLSEFDVKFKQKT